MITSHPTLIVKSPSFPFLRPSLVVQCVVFIPQQLSSIVPEPSQRPSKRKGEKGRLWGRQQAEPYGTVSARATFGRGRVQKAPKSPLVSIPSVARPRHPKPGGGFASGSDEALVRSRGAINNPTKRRDKVAAFYLLFSCFSA